MALEVSSVMALEPTWLLVGMLDTLASIQRSQGVVAGVMLAVVVLVVLLVESFEDMLLMVSVLLLLLLLVLLVECVTHRAVTGTHGRCV